MRAPLYVAVNIYQHARPQMSFDNRKKPEPAHITIDRPKDHNEFKAKVSHQFLRSDGPIMAEAAKKLV